MNLKTAAQLRGIDSFVSNILINKHSKFENKISIVSISGGRDIIFREEPIIFSKCLSTNQAESINNYR